MPGQEPAGSSIQSEAGSSSTEPEADGYTSVQEAGSSSTEAQADRRPLEAGGLDVAQPCSIAGACRLCMEPAVSEHSNTTFSFTSARRTGAPRINLPRRIPLTMTNSSLGNFDFRRRLYMSIR